MTPLGPVGRGEVASSAATGEERDCGPARAPQSSRGGARKFVEAGGLIFTQSDGDATDFNRFVQDLSRRLFDETGIARAEVKTIAIGEPKSVPVGSYAFEVFTKLKLLDADLKHLT